MSEGKTSPAKSKINDDPRWRTDWWDLHPLVEDLPRPIAWSNSSTIFTAHPTQPIVVGRLFPSSRQFFVASHDPIRRSPTSYEPPTVISVSPNEHWLFAFFPSYESDGVACLWNRGTCLDTWSVKECWPFSRGSGVVMCAWAGTEREWATLSDGSSFRLPPRGPVTPVSDPTLLLVTQAHQLYACYLRPYVPSIKMLSCSLTHPYLTVEGQPLGPFHDTPAGPKTSRLCTRATIAFVYGETSILVAMRSRRYPISDSLKPSVCADIDLDISLDVPQPEGIPPEEQIPPLEWGALTEEQTIELCEVKFRFDGTVTSLASQPLPPIHHPFPHLSGLTFVCSPPPKPDPSTSPRNSPKKDKQHVRVGESPSTFLVASFLDFEEYNTLPKSTVVAYAFARSVMPVKIPWTVHHVGDRSFFPRVLALSCPVWASPHSRKRGLLALRVDAGGPVSRRNGREVVIGNIVLLRLPDLSDDPEWEHLPLMAPIDRVGMDWPVNLTLSRNEALLCAATLCRTSIYSLPKRLAKESVLGDFTPRNLSSLSMALITSLQSRTSIADIAHILSAPAVPLDTLVDTLKETWAAFETNLRAGAAAAFSVVDLLGATVELYRTRTRLLTNEEEKESLSSLWKNAHDMCSVAACFSAFEDCKEPEGYDLEAIWQLVSLSGWVIGFLEKLVKNCLSASDLLDLTPNASALQPKLEPVDVTDVFALDETKVALPSPLASPILLHITHPTVSRNLVGVVMHVNRFYQSLSALTPKGEKSQIARDVLMDIIGSSGLDLEGIEEILKSAMLDATNIPADEARLSLSKCHPVPAQYPFLRQIAHTLTTSSAIDKPRLFVKVADLVDGFASLSTSEHSREEQDRDIVTKGVLIRRNPGLLCLRCGYRSEIGGEVSVAGHVSLRWRTWERMWASRCVCGGAWVSGKCVGRPQV